MKIVKVVTAFALLWFVFYGSVPSSIDILNPIPTVIDETRDIVKIEKPSDDIISRVKPVASLVTETEDRAKLALFNYEFSNRLTRYKTDVQQLNDVYVLSGSKFFSETMKDKYPGLSSGIENLFKSVVNKSNSENDLMLDDNHIVTDKEKEELKSLFIGFAWALLEK